MKSNFIRSFLFLLVSIFVFASCSDHGMDTVSYDQIQKEKFVKDFNSTFGVTSSEYANHDWGMLTVPMVVKSTTRGVDANGNQWEDEGYVVPADITADELAAVLAVFNQKGEESYTSLIDWDCYFVQQVYKGTATYKNHDNQTVIGSEHMDWLCTVTNKHINVKSWWPYEEEIVIGDAYDDHINDFNNGSAPTEWTSEKTGIKVKEMMLMVNTNSNVFGFKSSEDNGHVFYNFRMEEINGNYYVGFDFEANGANPNEQVDRDFIYNDWIVKIVPGKGVSKPDPERVRIMCEDLATNSDTDFDYNDIVFDIKFIKYDDRMDADIIIQAAGGTLPLTIGGLEVHSLFNVNVKDMVNTGRGPSCDPVHLTVTMNRDDYATAWDAINDLPVIVQYTENGVTYPIHLTTSPGEPAEMIAVPVGTNWSPERVSIYNTWPAFVDWIRDSSVQWWK